LMFRSTFEQRPEQIEIINKMIMDPIIDTKRCERVWENHVLSLKDQYVMNE
ncbi:MAG TPA: hypothetical protein GX404_07880, partial [Syntrophomonadaceae bacterium]|nr:hypothetical protein [Syntrophomonadaceae bacterium]